MRSIRLAPALVLAALVAGCDSNPTDPIVDVDATLDQLATGGISSYTTTAAGAMSGGATVPIPAGGSSSSCAYNADTKFFVCAPLTANGLTFSRQYQLLDASGVPLATPNALLVASIRSITDLEGTTTVSGASQGSVTIDRHEDATLSGIQSATRVLNGTATQAVSFASSSFSVSSDENSVTTNLLLPSSTQQKYPLGGSIVTTGSMTTSGVTVSTQAYQREILFDGTSIMTIKLTMGGTTTTCKINLASSPGAQATCS